MCEPFSSTLELPTTEEPRVGETVEFREFYYEVSVDLFQVWWTALSVTVGE